MSGRALYGAVLLLCLAPGAIAQSAKSIGSFAAPPPAPREMSIPWAKPLEGGRPRLLLVAPAGAMRDADELEARLDCELERVALPTRHATAAGAAPEVVDAAPLGDSSVPVASAPAVDESADAWVDAWRAALGRKPAAILLGNIALKGIPTDLQENIVALAQSGSSLLLANIELDGGPLDTFLGQLNPAEDANKSIIAGAAPAPIQSEKPLGAFLHAIEGETTRAVVVDGPGDPPLTHALLPPPPDGVYLQTAWRENAWSLLLRGLRWALRRDAEVAIASMADTSPQGPSEDEIPPDLPQEFVQSMRDAAFNLPLHPISAQLAAPAPRALEAGFQLRRRGESRVAYSTTVNIAKGAQLFGTQLMMNPGAYEVDCILRGRKGVLDWWTLPVTVGGWPEAENLKADKVFLLPNDTLSLSATVRPIFGTSRAGSIYARALDPAGDLLGEAEVPVDTNGGNVTLRLAFADLLTSMVEVEVYAFEGEPRRRGKVELASSGAQLLRFPVRHYRRAPQFELVVQAPARDEFNARWYLHKWAEHGARTLSTGGGSAAVVRAAELGLALLPVIAEHAPETRDNETRPCLGDPARLAREHTRIADDLAQYWAGTGGAYSLGWPAWHSHAADDANPCQSDACIDAFHRWLAAHYVDVNALNETWRAQFASMEDAPPPSLADAQAAKNPAPWMNWRAAMDEVFAASLASARGAMRGVDQQGAAGVVLLPDSDTRLGYDISRLTGGLDFLAVPPGQDALEKLRAFRGVATWGGLAAPPLPQAAQARALAWHALLEQMPGVWLGDAVPSAGQPSGEGLLRSSGEFSEAGAALSETVERIQQGAGPVILAAARARSGIAILDSRPSRLAAEVDSAFGSTADAQEAWTRALRRAGFDFTYVSPAQVREGALTPYRALILPRAIALDVDEAAAIARFAQQGGALLADTAPGVYTALGARPESPMLDEWFGIRHAAPPEAKEIALEGHTLRADTAASTAEATAKLTGEVPLHCVVEQEKHHALLLNYVPAREAGPWDAAIAEFLLANGCARAFELADAADRAAPHLRRARFRYGQAEILALYADPAIEKPLEVRVSLSEAQHAYDLIAHAPVDRPKKAHVELRPGEGTALALLPYEVAELRVDAPAIVQQGKRFNFTCAVRARKAEPGTHLVRVTLSLGDTPLPEYTQFVECDAGRGAGYLPIRLGQLPGVYTFRAEDLLSGASFTHDLKVVGLAIE